MVGKRICFDVVRKSYQFVDDDHCMTIFYGGALDVEVSGSFGWVDKPGGLVRVTKYTADR